MCGFIFRAQSTVYSPAGLLSSARDVTNIRKAADSYAGKHGKQSHTGGGKCGGNNKKTVDAATALGLGLPQQNTMLSGLAGLGMAQQNPLDSLF